MDDETLQALKQCGFRSIEAVTPLNGGAVHHVYRVTDRVFGTVIVKRRGESTKEPIGINVTQDEVCIEAAALKLFAQSKSVPRLHLVDPSLGLLIMSPIVERGTTLKDWIAASEMISTRIIINIFGKIEETLVLGKRATPPSEHDLAFFPRLLRARFAQGPESVVSDLVHTLCADEAHRCFIMGGLSFKNILYNGVSHGFCDFETFCYGHPVFDFGYYLGHAVLHLIDEDRPVDEALTPILAALPRSELISLSHERALTTVILLTMLYRVSHPSISYPLKQIGGRQRKHLICSTRAALNSKRSLSVITNMARE